MVKIRNCMTSRVSCLFLTSMVCNQLVDARRLSADVMKITLGDTDFFMSHWDDGRSRPYRVHFNIDGLLSNYFYSSEGYINLFGVGDMVWGVWYGTESISKIQLLNPADQLRRELRGSDDRSDFEGHNKGSSSPSDAYIFDCGYCEATWDIVCDTREAVPFGTACAIREWEDGTLFDPETSRSLSTMCDVFMAKCRQIRAEAACEGQCTYSAVIIAPCGRNCQEKGPCLPNPCRNGGTCSTDVGGGHVCSCPESFGGMACQTDTSSLAEFSIVLDYVGTWSDERTQVFEAAAARWSQVITHVTCSGISGYPAGQLLITAEMRDIDGEGGVLGAAGPKTVAQSCPTISLTGEMLFDEDDINDIEAAGYLDGVVQHEMGHTIGLGVLWGDCNTCFTNMESDWTCKHAKRAYNDLAGAGPRSPAPLVEVDGSSGEMPNKPTEDFVMACHAPLRIGTYCSHFDEELLGDELMTGWVETDGVMPLSKITAGALDDMGYVVDPTMVDEYTLPSKRTHSAIREDGDSYEGAKELGGKELGPMGTSINVEMVDDDGHVVERRPINGMRL